MSLQLITYVFTTFLKNLKSFPDQVDMWVTKWIYRYCIEMKTSLIYFIYKLIVQEHFLKPSEKQIYVVVLWVRWLFLTKWHDQFLSREKKIWKKQITKQTDKQKQKLKRIYFRIKSDTLEILYVWSSMRFTFWCRSPLNLKY